MNTTTEYVIEARRLDDDGTRVVLTMSAPLREAFIQAFDAQGVEYRKEGDFWVFQWPSEEEEAIVRLVVGLLG